MEAILGKPTFDGSHGCMGMMGCIQSWCGKEGQIRVDFDWPDRKVISAEFTPATGRSPSLPARISDWLGK